VQLPDQLFELFRTAKVQVAVPQKADRHHHENRQASLASTMVTSRGSSGVRDWLMAPPKCRILEAGEQQRSSGDKN
jgi:hypothetical protein